MSILAMEFEATLGCLGHYFKERNEIKAKKKQVNRNKTKRKENSYLFDSCALKSVQFSSEVDAGRKEKEKKKKQRKEEEAQKETRIEQKVLVVEEEEAEEGLGREGRIWRSRKDNEKKERKSRLLSWIICILPFCFVDVCSPAHHCRIHCRLHLPFQVLH